MEIITKLTVKEADIDELNHVNNAVYVKYLEVGRTDWYKRAVGFSETEMFKEDKSTVVLHIDVLFKQEALLGDELSITTTPEKLGNKSFVVKQEIYNQRNELITEATVTSVMFDLKERKSTQVVEQIAALFEKREN